MAADVSGKTCQPLQCIIYFLDDSYETFDLERREKAQVLLNKVFDHLDITDKKYFGLQFYDAMTSEENLAGCDEVELVRWIDPSKSVKKQLKTMPPYYFYFRVKFYVPDPELLQEEYTRFYYFLQCNKDISAGKLKLPDDDLLYLAAYSAQSELGDFSATDHYSNDAYHFDYLNNKPLEFVNQVRRLHKQLKGTRPIECEMRFLKLVKQADTYGVNLYKATLEQSCREIQIGVTAKGLLVFNKNNRPNTFKWADIIKLSFKRKLFFIHLHKPAAFFITQSDVGTSSTPATSENIYGFHMSCYRSCKNLWKGCVEHHTFFCLHSQQQQQKQQQQKQQQQKQQDKQDLIRAPQRSDTACKNNREVAVLPAKSPSSSPSLDLSDNISLAFLPISTSSRQAPPATSQSPHHTPTIPPIPANRFLNHPPSSTSPSTTHYMFDLPSSTQPHPKTFLATGSSRKNLSILNRSSAFRSTHATQLNNNPPLSNSFKSIFVVPDTKKNKNGMDLSDGNTSIYENNSLDREIPINSDVSDNKNNNNNNRSNSTLTKHHSDRKRMFESKHVVDVESSEDEDGKVIEKTGEKTLTTLSPIVMLSKNNSSDVDFRQDSNKKNKTSQPTCLPSKLLLAPTSPSSSSSSSKESRADSLGGKSVLEGLITVRMRPDGQGRFGFNVKGGSDLKQTVVVSRVAPGSPADVCLPNLCEGDHVLFINGRDISQHTHAQVVQFIRASRETHSGELVLVIQRNAYLNDASPNEPDFQYIPDSHHMVAILPPQADALAASMFLLRESLESGSGLAQFEQLYRKKAGMSMAVSQLPVNLCKNRYRDISPYDATRVKLTTPGNDYINASYVKMQFPSTGTTNEYIATQGPLANTTEDFWNMVLQEGSSLIIMLTVTVERGRSKCHKYWPDLDTCLILKHHTIKNNNNNHDDDFNNKDDEFSLFNSNNNNNNNKTSSSTKLDSKNNNNFINSSSNKVRKLCVTNVSETHPCDSYVCRQFILSFDEKDHDDDGALYDDHEATMGGMLKDGRTCKSKGSHWARKVTQLQYTAWPDHGVPDDCSDFLDFVDLVGRLKGQQEERKPCVVHCSAGIGRTGVLVAMETAISLMLTHQPVHLLDVVRQMREQRAMLIQTSSQYKFVCEAVLKVYDEKLVVPLDKHNRL